MVNVPAAPYRLHLRSQLMNFDDSLAPPDSPGSVQFPVFSARRESPTRRLQSELNQSREALRVTTEQCRISTRRLQKSHEELRRAHEELLLVAADLNRSQKLLLSLGEQLARVHRGHTEKIADICHANSEWRSLIASADIGILVLDLELRIKSFTPQVQDWCHIGDADIGCSLLHFTQRLDYPSLRQDAEAVLDTLQVRECEVTREDGRCSLVRMLPYRTPEDKIEGVVLTFIDITGRKKAESAWFDEKERAQITLASIGEGVILTDASGCVESMNPRAEALTGWTFKEARNQPWRHVARIRREDPPTAVPDVVQQCVRKQEFVDPAGVAVLIGKGGARIPVEYSAAPICGREGQNLGTVIVLRDISEHRKLVRRISHQATHDVLTGLINRPEFERRLQLMLQHARDYRRQHALCYLDLDGFKVINDTCGHVAGDALLRQLSGFLQARIGRARDTFARLGGDEFGLLLGECGIDQAFRIAEELRDAVQEFCFTWENKRFRLGVSIGITPISEHTADVPSVLSTADSACYLAKEKGRNCVQVYQPEADEMLRRRSETQWIRRLEEALTGGRFRLDYQPILALGPGTAAGAHGELLLRMLDEEGRTLLPNAFIPAAERCQQMPGIDRWVVRSAFSLLRNQDSRYPSRSYAINVSAQSLSSAEFLRFVVEHLEETKIRPSRVCFEITETAAIGNFSGALAFMKTLRAKGCRFALDDFGTGLSSLGYLKNLPVHYLKIDGSVVQDMTRDAVDCAMVETINRVGHLMGLKTIAESVETVGILEKLKAIGVDYAQGFGIGAVAPLPEHCRS